MAKWAEIKCPRCEELEAEIDFLNAQLEAWQEMAPPPEKGLLRKRLEERRTTLAKLKGQGDE
jgi:hypothetical protein